MPNKRSYISTDPAAWTARQRRRALHDKYYQSNRQAPNHEVDEVRQDAVGLPTKLKVVQVSPNPPPRGSHAFNRDAWADLSDTEPETLAPSSAVIIEECDVANGGLPLWRISAAEGWEQIEDESAGAPECWAGEASPRTLWLDDLIPKASSAPAAFSGCSCCAVPVNVISSFHWRCPFGQVLCERCGFALCAPSPVGGQGQGCDCNGAVLGASPGPGCNDLQSSSGWDDQNSGDMHLSPSSKALELEKKVRGALHTSSMLESNNTITSSNGRNSNGPCMQQGSNGMSGGDAHSSPSAKALELERNVRGAQLDGKQRLTAQASSTSKQTADRRDAGTNSALPPESNEFSQPM